MTCALTLCSKEVGGSSLLTWNTISSRILSVWLCLFSTVSNKAHKGKAIHHSKRQNNNDTTSCGKNKTKTKWDDIKIHSKTDNQYMIVINVWNAQFSTFNFMLHGFHDDFMLLTKSFFSDRRTLKVLFMLHWMWVGVLKFLSLHRLLHCHTARKWTWGVVCWAVVDTYQYLCNTTALYWSMNGASIIVWKCTYNMWLHTYRQCTNEIKGVLHILHLQKI